MKKIISLLLALITVFCLGTAVFATETVYITDQLDRVEDSLQAELNEDAVKLKETYGIGVFMAYVKGHSDDFDYESLLGEEKDYVLLLLGERGTRIYVGGKGAEIFSEAEDRDRLGYVHDEQDEWSDGIARYLEVAEEYLLDAQPKEEPEPEKDEKEPAPSEDKEEKKSSDEEGSSMSILIPVVAAVIAVAVIAFVVILRKKKA